MTGERHTFPLLGLRRGIGVFGREHRSTHRGSGYELASSRPYHPSDNIRAIDWAASARLSSARDSDEFIVREYYAEESPRVVLFVDRRPSMRHYPVELPWLHKPAAVEAAGKMIVDSAIATQGLVGYLDVAGAEAVRWLPPRQQLNATRISDHELRRDVWEAPDDGLARGFRHLFRTRADLPRGTFVFVLSDFLSPPPSAVWRMAGELDWDVVPVIVQDPTWEQSFPDVSGLVIPFTAADGTSQPLRLTRREVAQRREVNEERLRALHASFLRLGIDAVTLSTYQPLDILGAFLRWHERRHQRLSRR